MSPGFSWGDRCLQGCTGDKGLQGRTQLPVDVMIAFRWKGAPSLPMGVGQDLLGPYVLSCPPEKWELWCVRWGYATGQRCGREGRATKGKSPRNVSDLLPAGRVKAGRRVASPRQAAVGWQVMVLEPAPVLRGKCGARPAAKPWALPESLRGLAGGCLRGLWMHRGSRPPLGVGSLCTWSQSWQPHWVSSAV